jgi:Na+/H+-dicarboxylate symporter
MSGKKTATLTTQILIAMVSGAVIGVILNMIGPDTAFIKTWITDGMLRVIAAIFVSGLKLLVVPLVFVSLVCGIMALSDIRTLGRISAKAIGFYLVTTGLAISIALALAIMVSPGAGISKSAPGAAFKAKEAPELSQVLIDLVPSNPVASMAEGAML